MDSLCNVIRHMLVFNARLRIKPAALRTLFNRYMDGETILPLELVPFVPFLPIEKNPQIIFCLNNFNENERTC